MAHLLPVDVDHSVKRTAEIATAIQSSTFAVPFSQLAQHMAHIPVKDMEAWVHRTTETRQREIEGRRKVPRPPNQFLLYRSAYADVAQKWCCQDQMTISRLLSQSWHKEPYDVREKYRYLAEIEKQNHQNAFPNYRFVLRRAKKGTQTNQDPKQQTGVRGGKKSMARSRNRCRTPREQFSSLCDVRPLLEPIGV